MSETSYENTNLPYALVLEYENYIKQRRLLTGQKIEVKYKDQNLAFTKKQIEILKLIAKGLSNPKIAKGLGVKETAIKLLTYRIMKYLENVLKQKLDRFYLIVIAQQINFDISNDTNGDEACSTYNDKVKEIDNDKVKT